MSYNIENDLNKDLRNAMKDLKGIYEQLVDISDNLPAGKEKSIYILLRYLSNFLHNLSANVSITYSQISQLQDAIYTVYSKVGGEQPLIVPNEPEIKKVKQSVDELRERFEKTFGSLEDVIDNLNHNHKKDQEDLKWILMDDYYLKKQLTGEIQENN